MAWILANKGNYFREWVSIGPRCTDDKEKAMKFETEKDALLEAVKHWALTVYDPVEY